MFNIAICDDLLEDRLKLREDVEAYFLDKEDKADISLFESGEELVSEIQKRDFAIIFMDIYMEGISGVDASQKIRDMGKDSALIFTTTSPDHAMAGYGVKVSDYLLKPFERKEVFEALDFAIANLPKKSSGIEVISDRNHINLNVAQILYIEVFGHECKIHMESGDVICVNQALKSLEEEVGADFIRCHKSYLVNINFIARPIKGAFLLKNDEKVPIGTDLETKCREDFFDWSFKRTWGNW